MRAISEYHDGSITTIFSDGTSLSKGHNLIQRLSEDLDFRCFYNSGDCTNNCVQFRFYM
ncbi:nucleotidyl transferase AbiEii/AbiGii toxin family protein [Gilvimarinus chinensis]|uniref:nucleotidyl transferase AbiEii/AbiGii toxin family protein n=1 Tax=Gilvimarinus chinensis TaxID=396005 RepID=UPI001B7FAA39